MASQNIILVACGSFNPITIMHLRMFELARDYLKRKGCFTVIGGIISPVNDKYPKQGLAEGHHRIEMVKLGTLDNTWIKVSPWEVIGSTKWTRTCNVLQHYQTQVNEYLNGCISEKLEWMPDSLKRELKTPVILKLLCGADALESFNIPNLWSDKHKTKILQDFGMVVITRTGNEPYISIAKDSILTEHKNNISVVPEWIPNDISSTLIRNGIKNGDSVRYFVPDLVIDYINQHHLYQ